MLGVMIDCSRNAVMKPKAVKQFADLKKAMGYDTLMLYTEDTYEVDGQPLFGCMRGKYTKADLGVRTRLAYKLADKEELKKIIDDYDLLLEKTEDFYKAYQKLWFEFNKPHGFDIQDIRLGGLIQRIKSCRARLDDYINGSVSEIPELEEEIPNDNTGYFWSRIVSPNNAISQSL